MSRRRVRVRRARARDRRTIPPRPRGPIEIQSRRVRWIVRGDIDGFFGLALDNLVQLLLIDALCRGVLGFPADLVYGRILPGAAVSILVGNVSYAYAGQATGRAHRPHRRLRAALRHQHRVALRARLPGHAAGQDAGDRSGRGRSGARSRGRRGSSRRSASGVIELACALVAERVRKATPRAALLSTLAGIALELHLARLSLPHLRAARRRPDDARRS